MEFGYFGFRKSLNQKLYTRFMRPQDTFCFTGKTVDWVFSQLRVFKGWGFRFCATGNKKGGVQESPPLQKTARMGHPRKTVVGQVPRKRLHRTWPTWDALVHRLCENFPANY